MWYFNEVFNGIKDSSTWKTNSSAIHSAKMQAQVYLSFCLFVFEIACNTCGC